MNERQFEVLMEYANSIVQLLTSIDDKLNAQAHRESDGAGGSKEGK